MTQDQTDDQARAAALAKLQQDIQEGLESGSAGEFDIEEIKRRGRERLAAFDKIMSRQGGEPPRPDDLIPDDV
jgi:Arc/MetJ-type ribon-helix-helix transcriptional regulator